MSQAATLVDGSRSVDVRSIRVSSLREALPLSPCSRTRTARVAEVPDGVDSGERRDAIGLVEAMQARDAPVNPAPEILDAKTASSAASAPTCHAAAVQVTLTDNRYTMISVRRDAARSRATRSGCTTCSPTPIR